MQKLADIKRVYFIGIGGIGMSAIARYFNLEGIDVYGYDKTETTLTKKLVEEGMKIHFTENVAGIPDNIDLVIYTPAIPEEHAELQYFRKHNFPIKKRAEVLGILSRSLKTIAVAGTHGKTTTSSILTHLLKVGGVDCTAFLGGIMREHNSNFLHGKSDWVVVEADEYDRSFLHLTPTIATISTMDADHLDIYGDKESVIESGFLAFTKQIKDGGELIVQSDWASYFDSAQPYGIDQGKYSAENVRVEEGYFVFDYVAPMFVYKNLKFAMPGRHNVENAIAAITVAYKLDVQEDAIREALMNFQGIKRRFEFIYRDKDIVYINDYAHHPTELEAAITAAKELFPDKKITGIFQPHLYSRTRDFVEGFAKALDGLDEPLLMEIYPARELPIEGVSSDIIFQKMQNPNKERVVKEQLLDRIKSKQPEVLLTLGAGDINTFVEPIKRAFIK